MARIVWLLLGLHTTAPDDRLWRHAGADRADVHPARRTASAFGDVRTTRFYWYFVVGAWLPIYACLYMLPRL